MALFQSHGHVLDILNTATKSYHMIMGRNKPCNSLYLTLDIAKGMPTPELVTQTSLESMEKRTA